MRSQPDDEEFTDLLEESLRQASRATTERSARRAFSGRVIMMDFDVIIKNARIDDDKDLVDIGVCSGKISEIGKNLSGGKTIDAGGDVVVPAFIESHIHLTEANLWRLRTGCDRP